MGKLVVGRKGGIIIIVESVIFTHNGTHSETVRLRQADGIVNPPTLLWVVGWEEG